MNADLILIIISMGCVMFLIAAAILYHRVRNITVAYNNAESDKQRQVQELSSKAEALVKEREEAHKKVVACENELGQIKRDFEKLQAFREIKEELQHKTKTLQSEGRASLEEAVKQEETQAELTSVLEAFHDAQIKLEADKKSTYTILDDLVYGLVIFDANKRIVFINKQARNIFGMSADAQLETLSKDLKSHSSFEQLSEILNSSSAKITQKDIMLKNNITLEATKAPMVADGILGGCILTLHDVTRQRLVERLKTEFVSLAAHQLRTPLSAIKWTLRMLLEGDVGHLTKEQREFLQKSYESNERMIHLINQLLEVTHIEEGRYIINPTRIAAPLLVEAAVNYLQDFAERKGVKLIFTKPEESPPHVKVDIEKMRLVLANLIENAIQYTPPGGEVTVSLKYGNDKKGMECRVHDTGIGVAVEQQGRVFERFFRGANAIKVNTDGSGLGLYISKNIVEAHGGKIWFTSQEGKGSSFYFWLPAAKS